MNVKEFLSENMPTILAVTASAGVIGTGYAAVELGREIERQKEKENKKSLIKKAAITIGAGALTIGGILFSNKLSNDKLKVTKEQLATTTAALGTVTKLFHEYRKHEDPEKDKEIMGDIAVKGCYESPEEVSEYEYDLNGNRLQLWTDPYISLLSDGEYTLYKASEADVLAASNYVINRFCNDGIASFGMFYDCLRERGVDIPEFKGADGIIWEDTNERWDYYGRGGLDFSYFTKTIANGSEVNVVSFDDDDESILKFDSKLEMWVESLNK